MVLTFLDMHLCAHYLLYLNTIARISQVAVM